MSHDVSSVMNGAEIRTKSVLKIVDQLNDQKDHQFREQKSESKGG